MQNDAQRCDERVGLMNYASTDYRFPRGGGDNKQKQQQAS